MFAVVTKTEFWDWIAAGHAKDMKLGLKTVQDAFVMSRLTGLTEKKILEVGGGEPRVLKTLAAKNECWNADKTTGPSTGRIRGAINKPVGIRTVECHMGEFSNDLSDNYFDVVFSISVVEHVPTDRLLPFLKDCVRVLKPGGLMLHAIDAYLFDPGINTPPAKNFRKRLRAYLDALNDPSLGTKYLEPPQLDENVAASARWASNPDTVLYAWNKVVPQLAHVRAIAQSVSLRLALTRS